MSKSLQSRSRGKPSFPGPHLAVAAGAIVALAFADAATAAVPDADGIVHVCYSRSGGALRVSEDGKCTKGEIALGMSAAAPPAPAALPKLYSTAGSPQAVADIPGSTLLASLELPPADYLLIAKGAVENPTLDVGYAGCFIQQGPSFPDAYNVNLPRSAGRDIVLMGTLNAESFAVWGGTITVSCYGSAGVVAGKFIVTALTVDSTQ